MNSKPAGYPRFRLFTLNPPFFSWRVRCHKNNGSASIDASRLTFQSAVSFQIRLVAKTSQLIERTLNPKFIERTFTVKNVQNALFFRPVYNSSFSPPYRGVYTILFDTRCYNGFFARPARKIRYSAPRDIIHVDYYTAAALHYTYKHWYSSARPKPLSK